MIRLTSPFNAGFWPLARRRALSGPCALLLAAALCLPGPAAAQIASPQDLEKIDEAQAKAKAKADALAEQSAKANAEIARFKKDLQRSAAESASYEKASRDIDTKLSTLSATEIELTQALARDKAYQTELLAAFQRMSEPPPLALSLRENSAAEAARAGLIMKHLNAQLSQQAAALRHQLNTLTDVRRSMDEERIKLSKNEKTLEAKRDHIRTLVKSKAARANELSQDQRQAKKEADSLALKAKDLRELIARFERAADDIVPRVKPAPGGQDPRAAPPSPGFRSGRISGPRLKPKSGVPAPMPLISSEGVRFADARGGLQAPVQGTLKSSYGNGRKGLTVSARARAQVIAPFAGRIEFAGAFKNYDNVVILNVGQNYFMLLTGLGEIYVSSGEMVAAGEPVGLMPSAAQSGTSGAELYIELRKNGSPVNPKPWLGQAFAARG